MSELFASLPRHQYCHVERCFISDTAGRELEPCVWFGLTSVPGRAWGLSVLLECGAIYSHLPPHAIYFGDASGETVTAVEGGECEKCGQFFSPMIRAERCPKCRHTRVPWPIGNAQLWDCFSYDFALHEYAYLAGRTVRCAIEDRAELIEGEYLFTAQHYGDGYSLEPEQAKQYHFVALENGRLTCLPANKLVVEAAEFTGSLSSLPEGVRRQRERYSVE